MVVVEVLVGCLVVVVAGVVVVVAGVVVVASLVVVVLLVVLVVLVVLLGACFSSLLCTSCLSLANRSCVRLCTI